MYQTNLAVDMYSLRYVYDLHKYLQCDSFRNPQPQSLRDRCEQVALLRKLQVIDRPV